MNFSSNDFNSRSLRQSDVMMDPSAVFPFSPVRLKLCHRSPFGGFGWWMDDVYPNENCFNWKCVIFFLKVKSTRWDLLDTKDEGRLFLRANRNFFVFHPGNAENPLQRKEKLSSNSNVPLPLRASGASPKKKKKIFRAIYSLNLSEQDVLR